MQYGNAENKKILSYEFNTEKSCLTSQGLLPQEISSMILWKISMQKKKNYIYSLMWDMPFEFIAWVQLANSIIFFTNIIKNFFIKRGVKKVFISSLISHGIKLKGKYGKVKL